MQDGNLKSPKLEFKNYQ